MVVVLFANLLQPFLSVQHICVAVELQRVFLLTWITVNRVPILFCSNFHFLFRSIDAVALVQQHLPVVHRDYLSARTMSAAAEATTSTWTDDRSSIKWNRSTGRRTRNVCELAELVNSLLLTGWLSGWSPREMRESEDPFDQSQFTSCAWTIKLKSEFLSRER